MRNLNSVVKIKVNNDGEKQKYAKWCLIDPCNYQGNATLCTSEFFGAGESACVYESKLGVITCPNCIEKIKRYQKIKL